MELVANVLTDSSANFLYRLLICLALFKHRKIAVTEKCEIFKVLQ